MPDCEQTMSPQAYGEVIVSSDVSLFDGNFSCVTIGGADTLNDVLEALDAAICAITHPTPTYDASAITYTGNDTFACFNIAGVTDVEGAIEALAAEICTVAAVVPSLCIDDIALCNLDPDVLLCAFGSATPAQIAAPNDDLGSLLNEMLVNQCIYNALNDSGISAMGAANGGDTGSDSASGGVSSNLKDMAVAMTKYTGGIDRSWGYEGGKFTFNGVSLAVSIATGKYIVNGWNVDRAVYNFNVTATSDNYIYIHDDGTYNTIVVAIAAPAPATPADAMLLYLLTTNGIGITADTEFTEKYAFGGETWKDDAVLTRHIKDLNVTGAKMEDIIAGGIVGDAGFLKVVVDNKGRTTSFNSYIDIVGLANLDVLQYQVGTGNWENVSIAGGILPAATANQTLFYSGAAYASSSMLLNTGTSIGIGISEGLPTEALAVVGSGKLVSHLVKIGGFSSSPVGGGALGAGTYYYAIVGVDGYGNETVLSTETNATVDGAATTQIDLVWTLPTIYDSFKIYRGVGTGVYSVYQSGITIGAFSDDATGWLATANPAHTNTTAYQWRLDDEGLRMGASADELALISVENVALAKTKAVSFVQNVSIASVVNTYAVEAVNSSFATVRDSYGVHSSATNAGAGNAYAFYAAAGESVFLDSIVVSSVGASVPDAVAILELKSTTQGLLMPRMTAVQGAAIVPVNGLIIYVTSTDATFTSVGFWGYATAWAKL